MSSVDPDSVPSGKSRPDSHSTTERSASAISRLATMFVAQLGVTFIATSFVTGFTRPALLLVVAPLVTMSICMHRRFRSKFALLLATISTVATLITIQFCRSFFLPGSFLGPLPANMEIYVYLSLGFIMVFCAAIGCIPMESSRWLCRLRWPVLVLVVSVLVGLAVLAKRSVWEPSPSDLIRTVLYFESPQMVDADRNQELSDLLAMCGRENEAEAVASWRFDGRSQGPDRKTASAGKLDVANMTTLPALETLGTIAKHERLIVIMEAHNSPKHRQWIEQALPILKEEGFHDYAAEAIKESGAAIRRRGYPQSSTGHYVNDPSFGNLLRMAIQLDFRIHVYEHESADWKTREMNQAANLAELFIANEQLKLVVHVGYGHVFKRSDATGQRSMADYLWEMTGIEPYCIVQTWHSSNDNEARQLSTLIGADGEPAMMMPIPNELTDLQFRFPEGSVDALIVHKPSGKGPAEREHCFKTARQQVTGNWNGADWPVMICAYRQGETSNAIALDQVMLRQQERPFVLWVPPGDYEIRVFGLHGRIPIEISGKSTIVIKPFGSVR